MLMSLIQSPWNQWKCSHWLQEALLQALHCSSHHPAQKLCSTQICGSGQVSPTHPLGRCSGTRVGTLPLTLTHTTLHLRKKCANSTCVPGSLHFFTSSQSTAGCGALPLWGDLHRRDSGDTLAPWVSALQRRSTHALRLSPSQLALKT